MTDDIGCNLEFPDVGELTFPQWRDWLAQYNKFIGERDVRYAAGLRERDERIEKLEAALNCNLPDYDPKIGVVERLRQLGNWRVDGTKSSPIYNKSADRIEKLEAALKHCINALQQYEMGDDRPRGPIPNDDLRPWLLGAMDNAIKVLEDSQ